MTRKLASFALSASTLALAACATTGQEGGYNATIADARPIPHSEPVAVAIPEGTGYFASDSTLPFLAPDFTRISEGDYIPAFEQGMAIQAAEVQAIVDNPAEPTFENTIVALEKSGRMLGRVSRVFFQLTGTNTTDRLDEINTEISPKLTAHGDSITLNPELFARVKAVYDKRAAMTMTREDAKLLESTYDGMVQAGALLTD
ncbi:MAG: dipeptidyl carboxypeptidase II, partial [Pseudomonadota bacterium]